MQEIHWQFYPQVAANAITRAFIESQAKRQKRPKTVDAYARNIEDLIRAFGGLGITDLIEAGPDHIESYIDDLFHRKSARQERCGTPHNRTFLAYSTIQQRVVTARLFYDFCISRGFRANPVNPVHRGSQGYGGSRPERGILPEQERLPWIPSDGVWEKLVAYVMRHELRRNQVMILLAYDGALRRQELVSLRVDDFDFSARLVSIRPESSKSGSQRSVTYSAITGHLLKQYLSNERAQLLAGFGGDVNGPLFLSESIRNAGTPITLGTFNDVIERLRRAVNLPQLTTHTFRHLRCTVLKRCGLGLEDIALYAGHKSVMSTQIYIHLAPFELAMRVREATEAFDSRMKRLIEGALANE